MNSSYSWRPGKETSGVAGNRVQLRKWRTSGEKYMEKKFNIMKRRAG